MRRTIGFAGLTFLCSAIGWAGGDSANDRMFARMRALAGDWEGTFEWSGGRTNTGPLKASYYVTGNGSALVENLIMDGVPTMTTVYHLDGADLRMTHFCAARNQPRLKASRIDEATGSVDFSFVDITNVGPANAGHVEHFFIQVIDSDHANLKFTFAGGTGKSAVENIVLKRVTAAQK
jgi:hypothetical protein